jgi:hypothetical protein
MTLFDVADWPEYGATVSLWRNASGAAQARVATLVGALVPAQQFSAARLQPAPEGMAGGRDDLAFVYAGTAARPGDELRRVEFGGTARYTVQTVDRWSDDSVAFVERVY